MTPYRIGIVLNKAGLTAAQIAEAKSRLKTIAKSGQPLPIELTVPFGDANTETLVKPIRADYVQVTIIEAGVMSAQGCFVLFRDHDEVWCFPTNTQGRARQHAYAVHDRAQAFLPPEVARKYKLIPPWVAEPLRAERRYQF